MKRPRPLLKRVSGFIVATLLVALAAAVWSLVLKDAASVASDSVAREHGIQNYYLAKDGFRRDSVELTPEFQKAARELEAEITEATDKSGLTLGKVHFADRLLKELLQKRYSIKWRTFHEMNPEIMID